MKWDSASVTSIHTPHVPRSPSQLMTRQKIRTQQKQYLFIV